MRNPFSSNFLRGIESHPAYRGLVIVRNLFSILGLIFGINSCKQLLFPQITTRDYVVKIERTSSDNFASFRKDPTTKSEEQAKLLTGTIIKCEKDIETADPAPGFSRDSRFWRKCYWEGIDGYIFAELLYVAPE